jgi:glutathione S-transferase
MKLIIATPSPFARKARVVLREKNIEFEEIIDVPWNKDTRTKELNPLGKIPILLQDGMDPLYDSKVIVQYLEFLKQDPRMYPLDPRNNICARLIETTSDGVCDAVVLVFLENSRKENLRSNDWLKRQQKKIYKGIEYLSDNLGDKKYFVGDDFTIADICGVSCLEYLDLRFSKFDWRKEYPNLENFWHFHKDRKSFLETKPSIQIIEPLDT